MIVGIDDLLFGLLIGFWLLIGMCIMGRGYNRCFITIFGKRLIFVFGFF